MHPFFRLIVIIVGLTGTGVAQAGCLSAPPGAGLAGLEEQVGIRPDLVPAALDRMPAATGDAWAWREAIRAEAYDSLSQPQDARRIAAAALRTVDRGSALFVELTMRLALNSFRKPEAEDAAARIAAARQTRRSYAETICLRAAAGELNRIRNRPDRATAELTAAYEMASRRGMERQRIIVAEKLARVIGWGGDYNEAIALIDEVAAWYAARGQTYSLANALYFRAVFKTQRGSYADALRDLQRARVVGADTSDVVGGAYLDLHICGALIELNRVAAAEPRCLAADRVFVATGDDSAGQADVLLARIAMARGDNRAALRRLDRVLSASTTSSSVNTAQAWRLRSTVNAALGRQAAAFADLSVYVVSADKQRAIEREKQMLVQRARFSTDRQAARNRALSRDLAFAREREATQRRQTLLVLVGALAAFALFTTIVVMGLSHRRRLATLADLDSLTQLLNRRAISSRAPKLLSQAYLQRRPLALAIIDLDHFKRINDAFGHGVGDLVLTRFATAATATLRRTDLIARWGGEEFVLLLADHTEEQVHAALDRLRDRLEAAEIVAGDPARIRFSAGVSLPAAADTFETAVARADEALYEAKRTGRNRTVIAAPCA